MPTWKPTATLKTLQQRATIIKDIREFFYQRDFLEVETPVLSHATVTDVYLSSFSTSDDSAPQPHTLYLQTSPEYHMKRLLAANSGPIFQICKSFRKDELGRLHNPEFTMLEWYRPGVAQHEMMDEVAEFLKYIFECNEVDRLSYEALFQRYFQFNPHTVSLQQLIAAAKHHQLDSLDLSDDRDAWLQVLMSEVIEPELGTNHPVLVYDFPASQAALAKIRVDEHPVAERFEVYYRGIELANGFHELTDPLEQRRRFEADLLKREALGLATVPIDNYFLDALNHGLPQCSGIAVGVDRLVMLTLSKHHLSEVVSFTIDNA